VLARLRPFLPTAFLGLLILYFVVQSFTGQQGILMSGERDETLIEKRHELAALEAQRNDLEIRAKLLRNDSLSADLLEERARSLLGFADPRDYVIRMKP
jgi:cell division protein FtsB